MGKLADIKTKPTTSSVEDFINKLPEEQTRKDCFTLVKLMEKATKDKATMWGPAIIGFGNLVYTSPKTGRQVPWLKIGFSPRKANLSLYGLDIQDQASALKKLGKHKTGGGCLYINKLEDVDLKVLEGICTAAAKKKQ